MTTELSSLFEPIIARFAGQSEAIERLRADNAALAAEVVALRGAASSAPPPAPSLPRDSRWTTFPLPEFGARVLHVSASEGKNTNSGLAPDAPVESIARGVSLLRDGAGDRLLLKSGDTFGESFGSWTKSGRSPDQPLLISCYGVGPRPRVVSSGSAFNLHSTEVHDLALVGLHLTAAGRDPSAPGFDATSPAGHGVRVVRPVANLLVEDCRVDFFSTNITLTAGDAPGARLTKIRVRRCQVLDAWSTGGAFSGQGLYANGCDGLLLEENVFDHNGWNETIPGAAPNIFRHNVYLSAANTDVVVRGNLIANGASHGVQVRGGGVVEDNLFVDNALHCLLAGGTGRFRGNVVVGGRDIDADTPRGFGLTLACADGRADRNLFAHKPATLGAALIVQRNDWTSPGPMHAVFAANVVHGWSGNSLEITGDCDQLEFVANDLQRLVPGRKMINLRARVARFQLAANRYDGPEENRDRWFSVNGAFVPFDRWSADTGDTSRVERVNYADPGRAVPEGFIAAARARKRNEADDASCPRFVSRFLRDAFED